MPVQAIHIDSQISYTVQRSFDKSIQKVAELPEKKVSKYQYKPKAFISLPLN